MSLQEVKSVQQTKWYNTWDSDSRGLYNPTAATWQNITKDWSDTQMPTHYLFFITLCYIGAQRATIHS